MRFVFASFAALCFFVLVNCESNDTTTVKPTTTHKPDTTTSGPVTTTPVPVPPPAEAAPVVNYTIKGKDEKQKEIYCLMAEFSAKFEITYNNTKGKMETGYLSLNKSSVVKTDSSHCGQNDTVLFIEINGIPENTLQMFVEKKDNRYFVKDVIVTILPKTIEHWIPLAPQEMIVAKMENKTLFEAPVDKSYICKSADDMSMTGTDKFTVKMDVSDVRFDAFRKDEGNSYREGQLCAKDEEFSDIIPIAVGAALAALVVIVLIAYFIGRRRSRRLAYQSV